MNAFLVSVTVLIAGSSFGPESEYNRVRSRIKSQNYTVTWGAARTFDAEAVLEVCEGNGHGFTFGWLRFKPAQDAIYVLSIRLEEGRRPYRSKWPPDLAPVVVKRSTMKPGAYAMLLRQLAVVDSAALRPVHRNGSTTSTNDFWVQVRLTTGERVLIDLNWAGYESSGDEPEFAKPRTAVSLAREAISGLEFKEQSLNKEERAWASAKFKRDWNGFKDLSSYWWVKERYIVTIGVVGEAMVLPTLSDIISGDPKDRCVYHAINAVTRLTNKDVREKPVEEMDVEKTRRKVLDLLRDAK